MARGVESTPFQRVRRPVSRTSWPRRRCSIGMSGDRTASRGRRHSAGSIGSCCRQVPRCRVGCAGSHRHHAARRCPSCTPRSSARHRTNRRCCMRAWRRVRRFLRRQSRRPRGPTIPSGTRLRRSFEHSVGFRRMRLGKLASASLWRRVRIRRRRRRRCRRARRRPNGSPFRRSACAIACRFRRRRKLARASRSHRPRTRPRHRTRRRPRCNPRRRFARVCRSFRSSRRLGRRRRACTRTPCIGRRRAQHRGGTCRPCRGRRWGRCRSR